MKFIKTVEENYLNAAIVESLAISKQGDVVAWVIGDHESPYVVEMFATAEEAEEYLDTLISALGIVVNADD